MVVDGDNDGCCRFGDGNDAGSVQIRSELRNSPIFNGIKKQWFRDHTLTSRVININH